MILADTSVWVDHLRTSHARMNELLQARKILHHTSVLGELMLGGLRPNGAVALSMLDMPRALEGTSLEVLQVVTRHGLAGTGLGFADVCILTSALLTPEATLWTRDRKLHKVAERLGVAA